MMMNSSKLNKTGSPNPPNKIAKKTIYRLQTKVAKSINRSLSKHQMNLHNEIETAKAPLRNRRVKKIQEKFLKKITEAKDSPQRRVVTVRLMISRQPYK